MNHSHFFRTKILLLSLLILLGTSMIPLTAFASCGTWIKGKSDTDWKGLSTNKNCRCQKKWFNLTHRAMGKVESQYIRVTYPRTTYMYDQARLSRSPVCKTAREEMIRRGGCMLLTKRPSGARYGYAYRERYMGIMYSTNRSRRTGEGTHCRVKFRCWGYHKKITLPKRQLTMVFRALPKTITHRKLSKKTRNTAGRAPKPKSGAEKNLRDRLIQEAKAKCTARKGRIVKVNYYKPRVLGKKPFAKVICKVTRPVLYYCSRKPGDGPLR